MAAIDFCNHFGSWAGVADGEQILGGRTHSEPLTFHCHMFQWQMEYKTHHNVLTYNYNTNSTNLVFLDNKDCIDSITVKSLFVTITIVIQGQTHCPQ